MKTLNNYINEWKASSNNVSFIETQYFIYRNDVSGYIKIFDEDWAQRNKYIDKVYINRKHAQIDNQGWTRNEYKPGIYYVNIKDIDKVTNCLYMFYSCKQLVYVPYFDTSKVEDMSCMFKYCSSLDNVQLFDTSHVKSMDEMFYGCEDLISVPLFDTSNVNTMDSTFYECEKLSKETKKEWSKVYDFEIHSKKIQK